MMRRRRLRRNPIKRTPKQTALWQMLLREENRLEVMAKGLSEVLKDAYTAHDMATCLLILPDITQARLAYQMARQDYDSAMIKKPRPSEARKAPDKSSPTTRKRNLL